MQRIQSWFDQLSLGKSARAPRRRGAREKRRATAEPPPPANRRVAGVRSQSAMRKEAPKPVPVPMTTLPSQIFTSSLPRRNKIRTNPWVNDAKSLAGSQMSSTFSRSNTLENRRQPPPTLCVFSPDTSICSSGYASQDSSPETSMVWSEEFKPWKTTDENIYHQLQASGYSSPSCHSRLQSPVYAEPWTHYSFLDVARNSTPEARRTPMVVRNASYRPPSPMYAQPFEQQQTTTDGGNEMTDEELARDEFLWKLDLQIQELEMRSEELRHLMEQSKNERRKWLIPKMERSFELAL